MSLFWLASVLYIINYWCCPGSISFIFALLQTVFNAIPLICVYLIAPSHRAAFRRRPTPLYGIQTVYYTDQYKHDSPSAILQCKRFVYFCYTVELIILMVNCL
jgi:hypothetical protein